MKNLRLLASVLVFLPGCALSTRTIGMQDSSVEIVRALSSAQTEAIKALMAALVKAQENVCGVGR